MIATTAPRARTGNGPRIAAYIVTAAFSAMMLLSGLAFLRGGGPVIQGLRELGYPDYLRSVLGIAKVAGAIALVAPLTPKTLREWAYAGFTFELIGAAVSHASVGASFGDLVRVGVALALLFASYALRRRQQER